MQKGRPTMRKSVSIFLFLIFSAGLLLAFSTPAMADDDPPGRVARLNYIQGSVSFQPAGESDWVQANPNRPLTTGDGICGRTRIHEANFTSIARSSVFQAKPASRF